jgi:hypothetical protein
VRRPSTGVGFEQAINDDAKLALLAPLLATHLGIRVD